MHDCKRSDSEPEYEQSQGLRRATKSGCTVAQNHLGRLTIPPTDPPVFRILPVDNNLSQGNKACRGKSATCRTDFLNEEAAHERRDGIDQLET